MKSLNGPGFWAMVLMLLEVLVMWLTPAEKHYLRGTLTAVLFVCCASLIWFRRANYRMSWAYGSAVMVMVIYFFWYNLENDFQPFISWLNNLFSHS